MEFRFLRLTSGVSALREIITNVGGVHNTMHTNATRFARDEQQYPVALISCGHRLLDMFAGNLNALLDLLAVGVVVGANNAATSPSVDQVLSEMTTLSDAFLSRIQIDFFDPVTNPPTQQLREARRLGSQRTDAILRLLTPTVFAQRTEAIRTNPLGYFFGLVVPNANAGNASKPTDKSVLASLPVVMVPPDCNTDEPECCSICLESFTPGQCATRLPCGHIFCVGSQQQQQQHGSNQQGDEMELCGGAQQWLQEHNTCPVCRRELPVHLGKEDQNSCLNQQQQQHHQHPQQHGDGSHAVGV